MIYYFPNHKGKRVSSEVQRGYSLRVLVLQSAIHDFARRREKTLISPRCPPLSMHPSTPNTTPDTTTAALSHPSLLLTTHSIHSRGVVCQLRSRPLHSLPAPTQATRAAFTMSAISRATYRGASALSGLRAQNATAYVNTYWSCWRSRAYTF